MESWQRLLPPLHGIGNDTHQLPDGGIPIEKGKTNIMISFFFIQFWSSGGAVLAADLITASRSLRGRCTSSRLDHGLSVQCLDLSDGDLDLPLGTRYDCAYAC